MVDIDSRKLAAPVAAATPEEVQPAGFDMAILAMQESQYGESGVRRLMQRLAQAGTPCLALMNMPPPPYLRRIPGLRGLAAQAFWLAGVRG